MDDQNSRPEKDVARIRSIDRVERERRERDRFRGRQRRNSVAVGGSFNACTRFHFWNEGRKEGGEGVPHLLHVGRLGCIYHAAACLEARTSSSSLSLSLSRLHRGGEKRPAVSPGRSRVCLRAACTQRAARKTRVHFHVSTRMDNGGRHGETHAGLPSYASTTSVRNTTHRSVHDHASIRLGLRSFAIPGSRGPFTGERMKFDGVSETIRGGEGGGGGGVPLSPVVRSFRFFERKYR